MQTRSELFRQIVHNDAGIPIYFKKFWAKMTEKLQAYARRCLNIRNGERKMKRIGKNAEKLVPWIVLCVALDIIALALIPANLFLLSLPEWITAVFSILIGSAVGILLSRPSPRKAGKITVCVISVFSVLTVLFGAYCNPYWNSLMFRVNEDFYSRSYYETVSGVMAKEDLDFAVKYLQKCHPALINGLPDELRLKYEQAASELSEMDEITVNELSGKIQRLFAELSDSHTFAADNCSRHYLKDIYSHNRAGETLTAVNGKPIESLFKEKSGLYSFESESYGMVQLKDDLGTLEGLNYLGISAENGVVFTYLTKEGEEIYITYTEDDFLPYDMYLEYNELSDTDEAKDDFVYYSVDENAGLATLTLNECNYNEKYISCLKNMFGEIKSKGIKNLCVDLRENGGGNSLVANEFLKYLDIPSYKDMGLVWRLGFLNISAGGGVTENERYEELLYDGNVYLLTSYHTFSSAMDFAQYISDNDLGTLIGEPCGNSPNSFGEISVFKCPNSEITFQVSTKSWKRIDTENTDLLLQPDILCDANEAEDKLYELIEKISE